MRWLPWLLLLHGCVYPALQLPPDQQAIKAATVAGWEAEGLPPVGECLRRARIEWAKSAHEFTGLCRYEPDDAAACLLWESYQVGLVAKPVPIAFLRPGQPLIERGNSVATHEWLHALSSCHLGGLDERHANPRVWMGPGGATSAQGRAVEALRGASTRSVSPSLR